jgi:hypothetical protein
MIFFPLADAAQIESPEFDLLQNRVLSEESGSAYWDAQFCETGEENFQCQCWRCERFLRRYCLLH